MSEILLTVLIVCCTASPLLTTVVLYRTMREQMKTLSQLPTLTERSLDLLAARELGDEEQARFLRMRTSPSTSLPQPKTATPYPRPDRDGEKSLDQLVEDMGVPDDIAQFID